MAVLQVTTTLTICLSTLIQAQEMKYGMAHLMPQYGKIYEKLFEGPLSKSLSTIPLCYYDNYSGKPDEYYPTGLTDLANLTMAEYHNLLSSNFSLTPIRLSMTIQVMQLVYVSERDQVIKLMVEVEKWWNDCRLRWISEDSEHITMKLMPQKFHRLDMFEPTLRTLEALTPTFTKESLTSVSLYYDGIVLLMHEFLITASCSIDVHMYPFDIQSCSLTFESVIDETIVELRHGYKNFSVYNQAVLGRYVPSDVWSLVVLPPSSTLRHVCADPEDACYSAGLRFRIILRRQPYYQITNLLLPAFLIVIISSCVFLVPPGAGDKMGFSLSILLSLYMFCQLMYDKMPETGSTVPLLSQYFLVCIALVSTSCLYSAISAVFASACPDIPEVLRHLVVVLGPFVMPDLIECRKSSNNTKNVTSTRNPKLSKFSTTTTSDHFILRENSTRMDELQDQDQDRSHNPVDSSNSGNSQSDVCSASIEFTQNVFKGFCISSPQSLTWAAVGALFDRCFFIVHLLFTLILFVTYLVKGYIPWIGYSDIIDSIDETDMKYMCEQLKMQKAQYSDIACRNYDSV